ncbi:MAG TPA: FHA domain-containing serine/threonine-protein kinase [Urbifossiella sp.]|nr:FHA domain-containing serine/threonine-protein kinase [Urbifossiella sp.]
MDILLAVTEGPNAGLMLRLDRRDNFVVGRSQSTSALLPVKDPYLSRFHFVVEVNPPRLRVMDLNSRNGTFVNGERIAKATEIRDGDRIKAGRSLFVAQVRAEPAPHKQSTTEFRRASQKRRESAAPLPSLPGFEIVREVGRGGMGCVYEAIRAADRETVAIKMVRPAVAATPKQIDRFQREADILRQLEHPGIVRFHQSGEANGLLYFVMEFVRGPNAEQYVQRRGAFSVPGAARVATGILRALDHAHRRDFVHRDVKPANVILGEGPDKKMEVKLADFGLARLYDESNLSGLTMTGDIGGSPAFMAPEHILDFRNVGPAADLYGLSATLYFLLCGAFIFDLPEDPVAAFGQVLEGEPIPIRSRRVDVPERLAAVIAKGLSKDPADRYPSAEAMVEALRPFAKRR